MNDSMLNLFDIPLFGLALTLLIYYGSVTLQQRLKWLSPMLISTSAILLFLALTGIPYESYKQGGDLISFFLGPATVALAVPLYKYYQFIQKHFSIIMVGIAVGSLTGLVTAGGLVLVAGGSQQLMVTMLPKTATTPIAMEVAKAFQGTPELTAVMTVLTGLVGSVLGTRILAWFGITSDVAIGIALGTSSHGIGTARLLQESEVQGGISGFAMGMTGILIPIWTLPLHIFQNIY